MFERTFKLSPFRRNYSRSNFRHSEEIIPYQPHESLFENQSRWQVHSEEGDVDSYDSILDENCHFSPSTSSTAATAQLPVRSPLQSTTIHNQPLTGIHQSGVLAMLQQQQELLQTVLKQQQELKSEQSKKMARLRKLYTPLAALSHLLHQER